MLYGVFFFRLDCCVRYIVVDMVWWFGGFFMLVGLGIVLYGMFWFVM